MAPPLLALPTFTQSGNTLYMSNVNVQVQYNLGTGRSDFYWQNAKKIAGFYAGVDIGASSNYVTGTVYSNRTWTVLTSNQVVVAGTATGLPAIKQYFVLDQTNSFLTRVALESAGTNSNWMGPVVMDTSGGVDIGSYTDDRALFVPFDNDNFVRYNAMPINTTSNSYEACAFYDNSSRNGLVVGSVTHDTWKTGIYFAGLLNKLNIMNVYGGVTSPKSTWDVLPHGFVSGTNISSPTVFVGFGPDWRAVMESYADENALMTPRLPWTNGVPFGWNSWYAFGTSVSYAGAVGCADFIRNYLELASFTNNGTVYINLDSYWSNLSSSELTDFVNHCHGQGQKAGIYWTPWVWWGSPANLSNNVVEGSTYYYSDVALRTPSGVIQTNDGAITVDPTHPGVKQRVNYYVGQFLGYGFDYIKLDFLTHGAMEGVHYDPTVTTGIQAYNQGMSYLLNQLNGRMYISESIAPIFPYQYAHSRRISCDAFDAKISETAYEMQSAGYGWWLSGRCYQFNDPDMIRFDGATANENQSRLIAAAVSGTVFLDSDDLTSSSGQTLALTCLTNAAINGVARSGQPFRPVEGNTGTSPADTLVMQNGATWYVAVFNYNSSATNKTVNFARAGIPTNTCGALDLFSGALTSVSGSLTVSLAAAQSKLFELFTVPAATLSCTPSLQVVTNGGSTNFTVNLAVSGCFADTLTLSVAGLPPGGNASFSPASLSGAGSSVLHVTTSATTPSGDFPLVISGRGTTLTNSTTASLVINRSTSASLRWNSTSSSAWDVASSLNWFNLGTGTNDVFLPGDRVLFDDTPGVATAIMIGSGTTVTPGAFTNNSSANNFTIFGAGTIGGGLNLVKQGTSMLTMSTANNFTGAVSVVQGTLKMGVASALGSTNVSVNVSSGASLDLNGYTIGNQPLTVSGPGAAGAGAVLNGGGPVYDNGSGLTRVTLAGDTTFGGPTRWDLGGSSGGVLGTGGKPYNLTVAGTPGGIYYEWMNLTVDTNLANITVLPGATLGDKGSTGMGNPTNSIFVYSNAFLTFYNSTGSVTLNKQVTLFDGGTMQNGGGANVALQPVALSTNTSGGPGNCTFNVGAGSTSLTLSSGITGPGNLIKLGPKPLNLQGTNTYTGNTFVDAGTLALKGAASIANSPTLSIASGATLDATGRSDGTLALRAGQTLEGSGTVSGTLAVGAGASVVPGPGVGTLANAGSSLLQNSGTLTIGVLNTTNGPGSGYSSLSVSGSIGVQATGSNPFTLQLLSLNANALPGFVTNFDNNTSYLWTVASGTVTNFNPAAFQFDTSQFSNDLAGGLFLVQTSSLQVAFSNNHPPVAGPMTVLRTNGAPLQIPIASAATKWSDPDGDPVALIGVGPSTNGAPVTTNSTCFLYYNPNNVPDSFSYTVRDLRSAYRPGDTIRTASGIVYIQVSGAAATNAALAVAHLGPGTNSILFSGWPGYQYITQTTTNLTSGLWFNLSTNVADSNGFWTVLDSSATNTARFYRSVYQYQ